MGYAKWGCELLASWSSKFRHKSAAIWGMIPHFLMWSIWQERNACDFKGCERSIPDLKLSFFRTLFEWTNASGVYSFNSLADFLDSCTFHILYLFCIFGSSVHCLCALVP